MSHAISNGLIGLFSFCTIAVKSGAFRRVPCFLPLTNFHCYMTHVEVYTYQELREIALQNGIRDNKVHIGVWLQTQGYQKQRVQINHIRKTFYLKSHD